MKLHMNETPFCGSGYAGIDVCVFDGGSSYDGVGACVCVR